MKRFWHIFKELLTTVNFDGLRCTIKCDPSMREIIGALNRQNEIDSANQ